MATGTVKWFNNAKGYGFVRPDEGGDDLFVHYSYIQEKGYKTLYTGQSVEYELLEASKGYHAVNLKPGAVPTTRRHRQGRRREREKSALST
ncbi:cold-shock protein [Alloalcanivorax xenomutans]|jgi:cold shock protein|uniref:cold-shock protein n=1 Tax=Alloalcanivorax xenomutans TaxID=1094342 RepID=UPI0003B8ECEE|nr:cold shock domain-containing protein [Alloalcanivorax xenomutans]ERS11762.1 cold-shock protein [Alcanivorax sp. PN-3]KYZ88117.1 DNA-binding protein [Alcanivorax sp. KX64203]MBA4720709.1 cold shock domain-containing protein [Alcanivorax sp.]ARB45612.1 DNA-binding protein [Alloalcanivorax xenomutans]PHS67207.1 MAG: DNA-binding protein [Alcanivorax sp.]|tara:strand:+ start:2059 stop:2331 length:273 start_codon:yes stop_codon:yes gene_type:complete